MKSILTFMAVALMVVLGFSVIGLVRVRGQITACTTSSDCAESSPCPPGCVLQEKPRMCVCPQPVPHLDLRPQDFGAVP